MDVARRALLAGTCGAVLAGCTAQPGRVAPRASRSAPATAAPTGPGVGDAAALLAARGSALLARDLDAAGAVFASDAPAVRLSDSRALGAGLVQWAADVEQVRDGVVEGALRVRVDGEGREVRGGLRVGITGSAGAWALRLLDDPGTPLPWDLGDVEARRVRGGVVLLVGTGRPAGTQPEAVVGIADDAGADLAAATARVDAVWGADWPRGTAVVTVPTSDLAARLAGLDPARAAVLDALAVGQDARSPDGAPAGVRVVLAADRFARLSRLGRAITLTHELVHVATRAATTVQPAVAGENPLPRWLVEGYADHVARLERDVSPQRLAAPLLEAVAAGAAPEVPADDAFSAADAQALQVTYAAAWTLVTSAARRAGTPAVTALYRALAAAPEDGGSAAAPVGRRLADTCRRTLGVEFERVRQDWAADVTAGLAGWQR